MDMSVIVPCTRPETARLTIEAVLRQACRGTTHEVIAVVPDDQSREMIDNREVKFVVANGVAAPGRMRNIGAASASGSVLCFIDDDCIPPPGWLAAIRCDLAGDISIGIIGCRVVSAHQGFWLRCADYALFAACQHRTRSLRDVGAGAMAVRRETFAAANGFDEDLYATEDWDFCLKARARGWKCLFDPAVEVKHDHRCDSFLKIIRKAWLYGSRSGLTVQRRHFNMMSWPARLSVRMAHPALYWLIAAPYASAGAVVQTVPFSAGNATILLYSPVVLLARIAYHAGVWHRLAYRD